MAKKLTAASVEKIKANPEKRTEIPDGLLTGLYLVVQPTGRKSWAVRYRHNGKSRKIALGSYPAIDLAKARQSGKSVLQAVQEGHDPAGDRQEEKRAAHLGPCDELVQLDSVARTFLARYAKPKNRSWKETARLVGLVPGADGATDPMQFEAVNGGIVDRWGTRRIDEISRAEIIAELDSIVDRGAPVLANRTLAALRKMFNWAITRGLVDASPCDKVKPPADERSRDRVLSDDELRALWVACDELNWPFGRLFQMLALTGQRRDEVGCLSWREIEGDLWTIPRERAKNDKAHDVPLSGQVMAILADLPRIGSSGYVFTTNGDTPVSGFSKAKVALDEKMAKILDVDKVEPWRLHDIRRTVASGMARLGIGLAVIEKVLNHTSGSFAGIVGVYQRHEFADEKRRALEAWGRFVETVASGNGSQNVIEIRGRA